MSRFEPCTRGVSLEDIAARVEELRDVTYDPEKAHIWERHLHEDVMRAIAEGRCEDPAAAATAALRPESIAFPRWCA